MESTQGIREHLEVLGNDGEHIGTVDHLDGNTIKLTKSDRSAIGEHHWIPLELVEGVEGDKVRLNVNRAEIENQWLTTGPTTEV